MVRDSLVFFVGLVATGAPAAAAPRQPAFDETELVSGSALDFTVPAVTPAIPTRDEAFALDAEMRAFVAPIAELRDARQKMLALIKAMEERGMFSLDYAEVTRTASGTFHDRQGNCLSFTMLFIALARAAGLTVSYQNVEVPPSWSYDGQVVIATHVNAVVRTGSGEETIVDFNIRPYQGVAHSRRVSDSYALALFYTNLGAEAMLKSDYAGALALLRGAAAVEADIAGLWVNLGVLYVRHGRFEHAEAAYLRALRVDDEQPSALANLALVYESLGEAELAARYRERVQDYRERNPYYHYAVATRAYERQQFADALKSLRQAVRLKRDEHQFYALRAEVQETLGRTKDAMKSAERARRYSEEQERRARSRVEFEAAALR
jgi:tetratricopeptide (TPR) repeat protein